VAPSNDDAPRPGESGRPATRHDVAAFIIIGLLAIPILALIIGALFLPPGVAFVLVRRGVGESHWSWIALGVAVGAVWVVGLTATARKVLGRARGESA
jgi:hypothetical protein